MGARTMRLVDTHPMAAVPDGLRHGEYPLSQFLRAERGFLLPGEEGEVERFVRARPAADVVVEAQPAGIMLFGREEMSLKGVVDRLAGFRWQHLVAEAPSVRYRSDPAQMPWMQVNVRAPRRYATLLKAEFHRRSGLSRGGEYFGETVMLSGIAPLAKLLGFPEWVAQRTDGKAVATERLAEWRLIDDEPDPPGPLAA